LFLNAFAFAWHPPADVPYARTVVSIIFFIKRPGFPGT
jgi:hypothetical protein